MPKRFTALYPSACVAALLCGVHAQAQAPLLTSGFYGDHALQLVVAPDGSFTGNYFNKAGEGGKYTCNFLIHSDGKPAKHGGGYRVMTWWPTTQLDGGKDDEAIYGVLRVSPKTLTLQLPRGAHDGCGQVNKTLDVGWPVELKQEDQKAYWLELRIVQAKHTLLHAQPDPASETSEELYQGDVVTTVAARGPWQHVHFYSYVAGKTFSGWVQDSELLAPSVPEPKPPVKKVAPVKPDPAAAPDPAADPPAH